MKKFIAGGALLAVALFTFQPASADVLPVSSDTATVITAPDVVLPVDSPVVTTEPAPVAPVVEPVAVVPEPVAVPVPVVPEPVAVAPVTVAEPVAVAPVAPVAVAPVVAPVAPVVAPVAPVVAPVEVLEECATNYVCGLTEAEALAGYPDTATFRNRYIVTTKFKPVDITKRAVRSIINPAYMYVFNRTDSEIQTACKNIPAGDADMNNMGICHAAEIMRGVYPTATATPAK